LHPDNEMHSSYRLARCSASDRGSKGLQSKGGSPMKGDMDISTPLRALLCHSEKQFGLRINFASSDFLHISFLVLLQISRLIHH